MFCTHCGASLPDGSAFCTNCGAPLAAPAEQPVQQAPAYQPPQQPQQPQQPVYQQPQQPVYQQPQPAYPVYQPVDATQPNLLVLGILSLVFGFIVGIILGAVGRSKGKAYINQGGTLTGSAKVGYILSTIGMIVSIVVTVLVVIEIIVAVCAACAISAADPYYYY